LKAGINMVTVISIIFRNEEVKFVENVSMKESKGRMYVEARSCFFILYLFGEQILILSEKSQYFENWCL